MRAAFAILAFAALATADPYPAPVPGGVSSAVAPSQSPPPGCSPNYNGDFQILLTNVTASRKRDLWARQSTNSSDHDDLGITLEAGVLLDDEGRTGYIASNNQFQFDDPPQAGALFTAGFTVCPNGTLALGGTAIWYRCLSGAGSTSPVPFYNLYNIDIGSVCIQSFIYARPVPGSGSGPAPAPSGNPFSTYPHNVTTTSTSVNATASLSSSIAGNPTFTRTHTTAGGHTGGGGAGGKTTTPKTGAGAPTRSVSPAASSSSTAGAGSLQGEVFGGLAAGLLAFAAMF